MKKPKRKKPQHRTASITGEFVLQLKEAFDALGKNIDDLEVEKLATFITRRMGADVRDYHRPEHPLHVARNLAPIPKLAGLFHDVVYGQIDPFHDTDFADLIQPFKLTPEFLVDVKAGLKAGMDDRAALVPVIFGLENEAALSFSKGLNEFLSCLVMVRKLDRFLSERELVGAIACIEATIPFRKIDEGGLTPADRLTKRLQAAISTFNLKEFSTVDIAETIRNCRAIIEADLSSFSSKDPDDCFYNTWRVMFENFPAVRNPYFSVVEYRNALYRMYRFMSSLSPSVLYWFDSQSTSPEELRISNRTRRNLAIGTEYLKMQVCATCVVEAIALETGGDAPWEYFLGQGKRSREHHPNDIQKLLAKKGFKAPKKQDLVYRLLVEGRGQRSRFDRRNAPIAAFLYARLSPSDRDSLWERSELFIEGKMPSESYLRFLPKTSLSKLLAAIGSIALTRVDRIGALEKKIHSK